MTHHDSMTHNDACEAPSPVPRTVTGLRASAFGAVILLLAEYCLGVWVNLYTQLPAADHGTKRAGPQARHPPYGRAGRLARVVAGHRVVVGHGVSFCGGGRARGRHPVGYTCRGTLPVRVYTKRIAL